MADENTSTTQVNDVAEAPVKAVEAAPPPVKKEVEIPIPAGTNNNPMHPSEQGGRQDFQTSPHHHYKWHVEALVDGHDVYIGFIKDVSMEGAHLFLEHNLQNAKFVKLHVHIPPLANTSPPRVLEVSGKITSTIYDSEADFFRSGIRFQEFTLDTDRAYLQARLLSR